MAKTIITLQDETLMLLEHWGRWSRGRITNDIGFKSCANFVTISPKSSGCLLDDDDVCRLDRIVGRLKAKQEVFHTAIVKRYQHSLPYAQIARDLKVSEGIAKRYHDCGVAWIDGRLDDFREQEAEAA